MKIQAINMKITLDIGFCETAVTNLVLYQKSLFAQFFMSPWKWMLS